MPARGESYTYRIEVIVIFMRHMKEGLQEEAQGNADKAEGSNRNGVGRVRDGEPRVKVDSGGRKIVCKRLCPHHGPYGYSDGSSSKDNSDQSQKAPPCPLDFSPANVCDELLTLCLGFLRKPRR